MAFNDLLSSSFLFSIAIIIILIGGIFAYVSYRMSEQDHKISSMLGLISTMAGELQFFRSKLSQKPKFEYDFVSESQPIKEKLILDPNNLIIEPVLISVSDDEDEVDDLEDDEDDDDEDDDDDDLEDDDDDDDDDLEDDLEDDDETDDESVEDVEEVSLNLLNNKENNLEEIVDLDQSIFNLEDTIEDTIENNGNIKSIHLEEPIDLNFINKENESMNENEPMNEFLTSDLKSISITDLEETNKKQDYKKMSINKLREVVVEKGIIAEASKLKKQDLLKLLGDE